MKLIPMRFMGFEWHHNPREISFECGKNVSENLIPNSGAEIQDTGRSNMLIRGVGELYGSDCLEQFDALYKLFKKGGAGVLAIENIEPVFAVFEGIKLLGTPREDVLTYSFVFREVMEKKESGSPGLYTAETGESLWDISYIFGIEIDRLVRLNPQIKRPDTVLDGEEVRLC